MVSRTNSYTLLDLWVIYSKMLEYVWYEDDLEKKDSTHSEQIVCVEMVMSDQCLLVRKLSSHMHSVNVFTACLIASNHWPPYKLYCPTSFLKRFVAKICFNSVDTLLSLVAFFSSSSLSMYMYTMAIGFSRHC